MVTDGRPVYYDERGSDIDHENRQSMEAFMKGVECRRLMLGAFLDGQRRRCDELAAERCDRCSSELERREEEEEEGDNGNDRDLDLGDGLINRLQEHTQDETRRLKALYGWLDASRLSVLLGLRTPARLVYSITSKVQVRLSGSGASGDDDERKGISRLVDAGTASIWETDDKRARIAGRAANVEEISSM
ncbi:hypothetical protein B0J13DRAFT_532736 [Dactylonectria estremocensis]|uniref:Uncharacterized protein n=1 Tax=Dactylonectria estremocensis TaxID=1079267 RepID=A0A9P9DHB7_9HYPO|nr:hypothetical protein B0J13DRAFT_532736 [Dactylonectria estremocensis]